jgi:hypothetical protein
MGERSDLDWANEGWLRGFDTGFLLFKLPAREKASPLFIARMDFMSKKICDKSQSEP